MIIDIFGFPVTLKTQNDMRHTLTEKYWILRYPNEPNLLTVIVNILEACYRFLWQRGTSEHYKAMQGEVKNGNLLMHLIGVFEI